MRILFIHRNYDSGEAEIAGNWPPAWMADLTGALKQNGFTDIVFIDAMTNHIGDERLRALIAQAAPDVVGTTAITSAIYKAEVIQWIAKELNPAITTLLGGSRATSMYSPVLAESPWIDCMVRGEGEEIVVELMRTIADGNWPARQADIRGFVHTQGGQVVAKYNFVTPIVKPELMDRAQSLDGAMKSHRRFHTRKALFSYPWSWPFGRCGQRARYLLGCFKAFLRTFYDLGRVNYWGPQSKKGVDFQFDEACANMRSSWTRAP